MKTIRWRYLRQNNLISNYVQASAAITSVTLSSGLANNVRTKSLRVRSTARTTIARRPIATWWKHLVRIRIIAQVMRVSFASNKTWWVLFRQIRGFLCSFDVEQIKQESLKDFYTGLFELSMDTLPFLFNVFQISELATDDPPRNACKKHSLCCAMMQNEMCGTLALTGESYCLEHKVDTFI